jgi:hypothetical protein
MGSIKLLETWKLIKINKLQDGKQENDSISGVF